MGGGLLVVMLVVCGKQDVELVVLILVLVVYLGMVDGQGVVVYLGEVCVCEESLLLFWVGGNFIKCYVDVGQCVCKGEVLVELDVVDYVFQVVVLQVQFVVVEVDLVCVCDDQKCYVVLVEQ